VGNVATRNAQRATPNIRLRNPHLILSLKEVGLNLVSRIRGIRMRNSSQFAKIFSGCHFGENHVKTAGYQYTPTDSEQKITEKRTFLSEP
jgi:hypothetical protein